ERQCGLRGNRPVRIGNGPIVQLTQERDGAVPNTAHPMPDLPPVHAVLIIRDITHPEDPVVHLQWACNRASASAGVNDQGNAAPAIQTWPRVASRPARQRVRSSRAAARRAGHTPGPDTGCGRRTTPSPAPGARPVRGV
ncbi:MAG: hypothetical protein J7463_19270, partial [Roseiflexus sp.]|nr:hypothetical protein [Roseiflexus sp.]